MQIKEMAENMGYEVSHGIVDCLWVIGEPISVFKEAVERETGILTEVDTYDWITFLPMSDGTGAYNRYFGRLNTGKMKIRGVAARKGDTPEFVNNMQQEVFDVLLNDSSDLGYNIHIHLLLDTLYNMEKDLLSIDPSLGSLTIRGRSSSDKFDWSLIHEDIIRVSKGKFEDGHYADSVESAFKEVNSKIKDFYKTKTGKEPDGADLMWKVFCSKTPLIVLDDLITVSGKNVQDGYGQIFAGSMLGIRNPPAHANLEISSEKATHLLFLASHLMFMIDGKLK